MPRGVRSMDSLKNVEAQISKVDSKLSSLQIEMEELNAQKTDLLAKKKEILKETIVNWIMASGKPIEDIERAIQA